MGTNNSKPENNNEGVAARVLCGASMACNAASLALPHIKPVCWGIDGARYAVNAYSMAKRNTG